MFGQLIVTEYACEPLQPFASVAVTVKSYCPVTVGVPARFQFAPSVHPTGIVPAVNEKLYIP